MALATDVMGLSKIIGGWKREEMVVFSSTSLADQLAYVVDPTASGSMTGSLESILEHWPYGTHYGLHYQFLNREYVSFFKNADALRNWSIAQQKQYENTKREAIVLTLYMWDVATGPVPIEDMQPHFEKYDT